MNATALPTATVVKVTVKVSGQGWKLTIVGKREGAKEPNVLYSARHASLGDAMDAFEDWRRGVAFV